jgi:hypothetical protein
VRLAGAVQEKVVAYLGRRRRIAGGEDLRRKELITEGKKIEEARERVERIRRRASSP